MDQSESRLLEIRLDYLLALNRITFVINEEVHWLFSENADFMRKYADVYVYRNAYPKTCYICFPKDTFNYVEKCHAIRYFRSKRVV